MSPSLPQAWMPTMIQLILWDGGYACAMRAATSVVLVSLLALSVSVAGQGKAPGRLNPMNALHEKGLPVFGLTHPAIVAGRQRPSADGAATPAPAPVLPSLADAPRETMA